MGPPRKQSVIDAVFADDSFAAEMPLKRKRNTTVPAGLHGVIPAGCTEVAAVRPGIGKVLDATHAPPKPKGSSKAPAASKGVPSDSGLPCRTKFCDVGLLPPEGPSAQKFVDWCTNFHAPEMERDLLEVPTTKLADAVHFHLVSAVLLNRAQRQQALIYRQKLEGDILDKDKKILALEKELADLKKLREGDRDRRRTAEGESSRLKTELSKAREDHAKELSDFADRGKQIVVSFRWALRSIGCDAQFPVENTLDSFLSWLEVETELLGANMAVGRDFAAATAIKAICGGLVRCGCGHLEGLDLSEVDQLRVVGPEVNRIGTELFTSFWNNGGDDVALMNAAISRAKTREERAAIRRMVEEYFLETRGGVEDGVVTPDVKGAAANAASTDAEASAAAGDLKAEDMVQK